MKDFVKDDNSFKNISFIKFWLISYLFFMTFPLSLIFCFVYLGTTKTKQLKWLSGSHDNGSTLHYFVGYGRLDAYSGSVMSGVTFYVNGNHNTTDGIFTLYGLKK